ncbi:MAG: ArsR family transcriptional regulator [Anaerolineae bacterium]|nr:ArsR family transcriptional regulator [Anaerolineae bacterium]
MSATPGFNSTPAGQIVELLQRQGPMSVKDMETALGVTTTAVRQQIANLVAEGLVTSRVVREGVGRPHFAYSLTDKARSLFACYCDDLALSLYEELVKEVGPSKVNSLLERVGQRLAEQYAGQLKSTALRERVADFSQILQAKGILSDVSPTADGLILKAYNCPYYELAVEHREICSMEQDMMSRVLEADVALTHCMHDGHQGCQFVVRAVPAPGQLASG